MKRSEIREALAILGLDPDLTMSVSIYPTSAYVETVATDDGVPVVQNGDIVRVRTEHEIEEDQ